MANNMKMKIVRRWGRYSVLEGCEEVVYDIYRGFTGLPATWPFHTKWIIEKSGLSEDEALKLMGQRVLYSTPIAVNQVVIKIGI